MCAFLWQRQWLIAFFQILRGVRDPHSLRITGLKVHTQSPFFRLQGPPHLVSDVPTVTLQHLIEHLLSIS